MNVCLVIPSIKANLNVKTSLVISGKNNKSKEVLPIKEVSIFRINSIKDYFRLNDFFLKKVDVLHIFGLWSPFLFLIQKLAMKNNIPIVISPCGMLNKWAINHKKMKKKFAWEMYQKKIIKLSAIIHSTSKNEKKDIIKKISNKKVKIIPIGIELEDYVQSDNNRNNKSEIKKLLFIGRIHPVKGLVNLINALSKIENDNWECIIAGPNEDDFLNKLIQLTKKHSLEEKVNFMGSVDFKKKIELLNQADVFISPSHSENFGITILEALSTSVPVITTKNTPWEIINRINCGWCINSNSLDLAKTIEDALELSKEALQVKGLNGRRFVENFFSMKIIAKDMLQLYKGLD